MKLTSDDREFMRDEYPDLAARHFIYTSTREQFEYTRVHFQEVKIETRGLALAQRLLQKAIVREVDQLEKRIADPDDWEWPGEGAKLAAAVATLKKFLP